jgi:hypothetical protein
LLDEIEYHFDKIDIENCRKIPAFRGVTATVWPLIVIPAKTGIAGSKERTKRV